MQCRWSYGLKLYVLNLGNCYLYQQDIGNSFEIYQQ
jgi:hypothetical protein